MESISDQYWQAIFQYQEDKNYTLSPERIQELTGKVFTSKRGRKKLVDLITSSFVESKVLGIVQIVGSTEQAQSIDEVELFLLEEVPEKDIAYFQQVSREKYDVPLTVIDRRCQYSLSPFMSIVQPSDSVSLSEFSASEKLLCKVLSEGADTLQIKKSVLQSLILLLIYEKGEINRKELLSKVNEKLKINEKGLNNQINSLLSQKRIEYTDNSKTQIRLSQKEMVSINDIIIESENDERSFGASFEEVLARYKIEENAAALLSHLRELITASLEVAFLNYDQAVTNAFDKFSNYLKDILDEASVKPCLDDLKRICSSNPFLNRACASDSFCKLYNSGRLEKYVNGKTNTVFLDTPVIVYYLCSLNQFHHKGHCWEEKYFVSAVDLISMHGGKLVFKVYEDYLKEVAGEIQKALRLSWFHNNVDIPVCFQTNNTFYNYYLYLKTIEGNSALSFESFLTQLGITQTNPELTKFIDTTAQKLRNILKQTPIIIEERESFLGEEDMCYEYSIILHDKNKKKTERAIRNDVRQALYLLLSNRLTPSQSDYYLVSWDYSICDLRDEILSTQGDEMRSFKVYNPGAMLSRLALSTFNVSKIDYTLWAFADKTDQISEKYKSLFDDVLVPLFAGEGATKSPLPGELLRIQQSFMEREIPEDAQVRSDQGLPLELIFNDLRDQMRESVISENELKRFLRSADNEDSITKFFTKVIELLLRNIDFESEIKGFVNSIEDWLAKENTAKRSSIIFN